MPGKEKLTPEQVVEALLATDGMVYLAAERLGCVAQTVYNYASRYKVVKEALEHQKGKRLDTAESRLWKAVLDGEAWAICFYLKTQGKARGYVEKQIVEQEGETRLIIVEEVADPPVDSPPASGAAGLPPQ